MSFLEHPVQIKKEEHSLTTSQKMLLYMWASYINHKIRLGKFSQVDYNYDLTILWPKDITLLLSRKKL